MAYTLNIPEDLGNIFVNDQLSITPQVTWDATDKDIEAGTTITVSQSTPTTVKPAYGGSLPLTLKLIESNIDKTERKATFKPANLTAIAAGSTSLTFTMSPAASQAKTLNLNILPSDTTIKSSDLSLQSMPVATTDDLTPLTAEANQQSKITVTATSGDTPVANLNIIFTIKNSNLVSNGRGGRIFDPNQDPSKPLTGKASGQASRSFTVKTQTDGTATLIIVANTIPAFLDISIDAGTNGVKTTQLYLYDNSVVRTQSAPSPNLKRNSKGIFDASLIKGTTFSVDLNDVPLQDTDFVGLILNDKFQTQLVPSDFRPNPIDDITPVNAQATANVVDLLGNNAQNILFYTIGRKGSLYNSQRIKFLVVTGPEPMPTPTLKNVGPFVSPDGGIINLNSFKKGNGIDFVIPVGADKDKLQKGGTTLTTTNIIRLYVSLKGDNSQGQPSKSTKFYDQAITSLANDAEQTINVPADDFIGFGPTLNPPGGNIYLIFYQYLPSSTVFTPLIGDSIPLSGPISTAEA